MVAEKMADAILGNKPLEAKNINVWVDPNWQNSQRQGSPERSVNNY
jgi:choline dehydrogenase